MELKLNLSKSININEIVLFYVLIKNGEIAGVIAD
jgi:hypothetical protein